MARTEVVAELVGEDAGLAGRVIGPQPVGTDNSEGHVIGVLGGDRGLGDAGLTGDDHGDQVCTVLLAQIGDLVALAGPGHGLALVVGLLDVDLLGVGQGDLSLDVAALQRLVHSLEPGVDGVEDVFLATFSFFSLTGVQDEDVDGAVRGDVRLVGGAGVIRLFRLDGAPGQGVLTRG